MNFFVFAHYKSSKIVCITHLFYWFVAIQFDFYIILEAEYFLECISHFSSSEEASNYQKTRTFSQLLLQQTSMQSVHRSMKVLWVLPSKTSIYLTLYLTLPHFFFTDYIARSYNRAIYVECIFRRILNHYRRI